MLTLQVRKGFEGSNPSLPAAQACGDLDAVRDEDVAWAAGFFEGEGTISGYGRRDRPSRTVQITAYETSLRGRPLLLERFQQIVGGGSIVGPYRGRLYHWTTKKIATVGAVSSLLWRHLSPERRDQFRSAFRGSPRFEALADGLSSPVAKGGLPFDRCELAWAAGLFDGEGSITLPPAGHGAPRLELPQASADGHPHSSLLRLHHVVGVGRISGPRYLKSSWSKLPQCRWEATSFESAQAVIAMLWPYLGRVKRDEAHGAFAAYIRRARRSSLPISSRSREEVPG